MVKILTLEAKILTIPQRGNPVTSHLNGSQSNTGIVVREGVGQQAVDPLGVVVLLLGRRLTAAVPRAFAPQGWRGQSSATGTAGTACPSMYSYVGPLRVGVRQQLYGLHGHHRVRVAEAAPLERSVQSAQAMSMYSYVDKVVVILGQ